MIIRGHRKQFRQPRACSIDPAFHRADRTFAQRSGILIGQAGRTNQDQRLAVIGRKTVQSSSEVLKLHVALLRRTGCQASRVTPLFVADLVPPLAKLGIIFIPENRIQPRVHIGTRLERTDIRPGFYQGLLDEIFGARRSSA